jgi:hypothetical protein
MIIMPEDKDKEIKCGYCGNLVKFREWSSHIDKHIRNKDVLPKTKTVKKRKPKKKKAKK